MRWSRIYRAVELLEKKDKTFEDAKEINAYLFARSQFLRLIKEHLPVKRYFNLIRQTTYLSLAHGHQIYSLKQDYCSVYQILKGSVCVMLPHYYLLQHQLGLDTPLTDVALSAEQYLQLNREQELA